MVWFFSLNVADSVCTLFHWSFSLTVDNIFRIFWALSGYTGSMYNNDLVLVRDCQQYTYMILVWFWFEAIEIFLGYHQILQNS